MAVEARSTGVAPADVAAAEARTGSRTARWRVAGRLARRQVRRTWVSSLLIASLVALPIAGMSGLAVYVDSTRGTVTEKVRAELGQMQAWVQPGGVPGAGLWQVPDDPYWTGYPPEPGGGWREPEGEAPTDPTTALPQGAEVVRLSSGEVRIETTAGVAVVAAWAGPVADPRFDGRFTLIDGRAPHRADEVLVTPATLERTGARIGGVLALADGEQAQITGTFRAIGVARDDSAVAFFDAQRFDFAKWYLPDLALSWSDVQGLNDAGLVAYSRAVVLDPPPFTFPDGNTRVDSATQELYIMLAMLGGLAAGGVAAGYMVVMLAGAAFAVSARRQQRALAIAASVGADARDLRRTVVLQGTVLGLVGGGVGVAVGVALAALVITLIDNGSGTMFWGLHVPWLVLVGILVFAVIVGTVSALMPARGVTRTDTISALRGARRPVRVTASRPLWGSLMVVVGVGITLFSGVAAAAVAVSDTIEWDSPLRWIPVVGIIGGPILAQLGILLSGRWLLWLASRVMSRMGIASRIASRDAIANAARTVPAFAAIGATVFVGVFAVGAGTMTAEQGARNYSYNSPVGTAQVVFYEAGPEPLTDGSASRAAASASRMLDEVGANAITVIERQVERWNFETESDVPADLLRAVAVTPDAALVDPEGVYSSYAGELASPANNLTVIAPEGVEVVTGVRLTAAELAAYRAGAALVTDADLVTDGTIEVAAWFEREWMFGGAPSNIFEVRAADEFSPPQWTRTVDAVVVDAPLQPVTVAIAPATARDWALTTSPRFAFGSFPEPPTTEQQDRLQALSEAERTDEYGLSAWIETGPLSSAVWLVPLLVAVAVLVLGASAVALGLARFERRPDDATLSAVGGTNGLRRRIGFWQGLLIAGFGTFAGAAAGILPPIGFWLQSQTAWQGPMQLTDIPWWLLAALAVALPLTIAVVNWLVPPRRPDLTRRTAIA